jgi:hypothetical protein
LFHHVFGFYGLTLCFVAYGKTLNVKRNGVPDMAKVQIFSFTAKNEANGTPKKYVKGNLRLGCMADNA